MGERWCHVMINTRCSWLHGDKRGFRNRGHRIHSSGYYKHRPPRDEHERLRRFHQQRSGKAVSFTLTVRIQILRSFVLKMESLGHRIIAASCGKQHLHALPELPVGYRTIKRIIGKCKQRASYDVRDVLPGSIWSEGGKNEEIRNKGHFHNTYDYIRAKQEAGTVVWSHRPDENWIADSKVGVIVMGYGKKRIRVFADAQTPASERKRRPGS